ncbi:MAG: hypothetical protein V9G15_10030 [Dermatophilaceae bacterium]
MPDAEWPVSAPSPRRAHDACPAGDADRHTEKNATCLDTFHS